MSYKNNKANRMLSVLLAILMVATIIPTSVVTAFALPNETTYNFIVKDVNDNPIEDVTFTFEVDGIEAVQSDAEGKASVVLPENTECTYVVEKIGFEKVENTINSETEANIEIQLKELAAVTVAGVVCDEDGKPLENVDISVTGYCDFNTLTDVKGEFTIANVYDGQEYTLTATLDGYKKVSQTLVLDANNKITLSLKKIIEDFSFKNAVETFEYTTDSIKSVTATSASYPDAIVKYSSSDTSVITVDENTGDITCVSVGEAVITATVEETDEYLKTTASVDVVIQKATQSGVEWEYSVPSNLSWKDTFTNVLTGGVGGSVTYSSDDEDVATVDSSTGLVTFLKPGEVTITGVMNGNEFYQKVSKSYTIEVGKAAQSPLVFAEKNPDAIFYGDNTYSNLATGGSVSGDVTYKSSDNTIATVDADGKITTLKSGTVTITATLVGNDLYKDVSTSYNITIYKASQKNDFLFSKGDTDKEIVYGDEFENPTVGEKTRPVSYESSDDTIASVDENGKITAHKAGEVKITASVPADERYEAADISYKLIISKSEQMVVFENTNIPVLVYGDSYVNTATAKTTITYTSSDDSIAKVNPNNGELEILKAGTVEITATAAESEQYKEASKSYSVTINKAEQIVSFELGTAPETTFNVNDNKFINTSTTSAIEAGENDIACVYSVVSGSEFVDGEINKTTGEFTIKGAGTIVVNVAFDSNGRYNLATASYTLTVNKANQTISFPQESYTAYSADSFNDPVATPNGDKFGSGKITYSVDKDDDGVIESIDASTGVIVFTNEPGTATVLATKAEDANYNKATATYTVTFETIDGAEGDYYTLSGDVINGSGWYTGNVSIVAKDGYKLGYSRSLKEADWFSILTDAVTDDGKNNVTFYAKKIDKNGKITGFSKAVKIEIKKDTVAPTAYLEVEEISAWDNFLTFIKEGKFNKTSAQYSAVAFDATSGIGEIVYFIDYGTTEIKDKATLDALDDSVWSTNEPIPENNVCVVYAKVTDKAGHYVYATTNGIVFDAAKPTATITLPETVDGSSYYVGDVDVTIDVADASPSSGIKEVTYKTYCGDKVICNVTTAFTNDNPKFDELSNTETINFTLDSTLHNSDNVKIVVDVVDNAGNVNTVEKTLKVAIKAPQISVTYEDIQPQGTGTDGTVYYNQNRKAYVTITCRDSLFDTDVATKGIKVCAENNEGEITGNYSISKWVTKKGDTPDDTTHTATVTFKENARYNFTVDYTNKALLSAVGYKSEDFAIDKDEPTGEVSVDGNVWNELLEKLTFGLWSNETVTVSATSDDVTGEIKKVEYYKSNSDKIITKAELKALEANEWTEYTKFTVSADEQFTVYFKIVDYANNVTYICSDGYVVDDNPSNIVLDYESPNANNYYEDNLSVNISVLDETEANNSYSGIQKVEYWVTADGVETQREVLYSYEYIRDEGNNSNGGTLTIKESGKADIVKNKFVPTKNDLKSSFEKTVVVEALKNNSDNVRLYVEVTDNAGNVSRYKDGENDFVSLRFDETAPAIDIAYDINICNVVGDRGFFRTSRKATVVITERPNSFNADNATAGILIQALDAEGNVPVDENGKAYVDDAGNAIFDENGYVIDKDSFISEWVLSENKAEPDKSTFTAEITYLIEANYTFSMSYTDNASNPNSKIKYADGTKAESKFTIDKTKPTATVSVAGNTWDTLLKYLTFGLWSNLDVYISADADDITSPVHIQYYKTDSTELLSENELDMITDWVDYTGEIEVKDDERLTVYLKVTDDAGNSIYLNSDGYIVDKTNSVITLTPEAANENDIYNDDVEILICVKDQTENNDYYSGIQKVEYWITSNGEETQREVLYSYEYVREEGSNNNGGTLTIKEKGEQDIVKENAVPTKNDLRADFSKAIVVDSVKNNSSDVKVYVTVTDNAGNITNSDVALDIDITAPVIDISYDNNDDYKVVDNHGYFPAERTATIVITERANHFDAKAATDGIKITAKDIYNNVVIKDCEALISDWSTEKGDTPDSDKHTATITYTTDANYVFEINYTDKADNVCSLVNSGDSVTPYSFTVDKTAPTGTVTVGELGTWDNLIAFLTFGLWSKDSVEVSNTADDATAGVESISYYKTAETKALTKEQLKTIDESLWVAFDNSFEVPANDQFTVYVRIIDNSGNVTFISTDGVIVDNVKPEFIPALEETKPEISLAPVENDINGVFKSNVTIAVKVEDPVTDDAYSGLKEIRYVITNMGEKTQEGILYSFGEKMPTQDKLRQVWEDQKAIIVDSTLNNSNDVLVKVYAVDNAGNENEATLALKLDITAPKIDVMYDNNDGDTSFAESTYFNNNRVATIVVTERNFDPADVVLKITNTDGVIPVLSAWKTVVADGNGDNAIHTAQITFSADGDYTFDIAYVDEAGNSCDPVNYGESLAPIKFTVDKTVPVFTVTYDNNEALNDNYYKAQRVATIVVKEHNFETSRVNIQLTATDNGAKATLPSVTEWVSSGDVHTATITYAADSHYTFDFDYVDKAGNSTANIDTQEFYVDKTNPVVSITGIVDQSANKTETVGFVISATDTNLDSFVPEVTVTDINGNRANVNVGAITDIVNGKSYVVRNIEADGIYRISCTVVDKAGNAFSQVTLQRENGSTYVENRSGNDTLLTFSVNRDGSSYEVDDATTELNKNYYVQNVTDDIVIIEVNANELSEFKVTLNNEELVQGKDYKVTQTGGNGSWFRYTYTISKSLFDKEGEYKVVVSSKDAAGNDAFSDVKDTTVSFVVDRTPPIVTVSGLASGQDYQVESQKVTIMPTDDGGELKSLIVRLVDEDGNTIEEIINLVGDALIEALEKGEGKIVFEINEGVDQNVQIICSDNAVDADGKTNTYDETFTDIDISPSAWKLFWADPFLRWGSIAGVVILFGFIIFIIIKRKKKEDKEA